MNARQAFIILFAMLSTATYAVESIDFSYSPLGEGEWFGYKRAETYDVAVKIDNKSLAGSFIESIGVGLPNSLVDAESATGWISTALIIEKDEEGKKVNMPDVVSVAATVTGDSLYAVFPTPVMLPEEGLYVGYSFTVTESDAADQLPVVDVGPVPERYVGEGWWMHCSKSLIKWNDMGTQKNLASKLRVTFSGDFHENSAALELPEKLWNVSNQSNTISTVICNNGTLPIESVDYFYKIGENSGQGHYVFTEPLASIFGYPHEFAPEIEGIDLLGWYPFEMTISRVNGIDNLDFAKEATSYMDLIPFKAASRPLVEEYTGLWCGWCPSGYVALEQMYDEYPENFVGISYHTRDVMTVCEENELPSAFQSLPAMIINRQTEYNPLVVKSPWLKSLIPVPPAEMNLKISASPDSIIDIECQSRFVNDFNGEGFKIGYILIADNLHNESWRQANYYSGNQHDELKGPYSDIFNFGDDYITDLPYDHVAVSFSKDGTDYALLPDEIKSGEEYTNTGRFDVKTVHNISGDSFFNVDTRFRVVAFLIDNTDTIYTSTQSESICLVGAGIEEMLSVSKQVIAKNIYRLDGTRCAEGDKGPCIVVTKFTDGSTKTEKKNF